MPGSGRGSTRSSTNWACSTAALPVPREVVYDRGGIATVELPGLVRGATTVLYGNPDFHGGFSALRAWIAQAGEVQGGDLGEVYLDCDGPRDTWVVELQVGLRQPTPVTPDARVLSA